MSNDVQVLRCLSCDAPLTVQPGESIVKCAYCGAEVQVPVAPHSTPPASLPASAPAVTPGYFEPVSYPSFGSVTVSPQKVVRAFRFFGCLGTVVIIGLCAASFFGILHFTFIANPSYNLAMKMALSSPKVTSAFGTPINPGFFIFGSASTKDDHWSANYDIPIFGPRRSGKLHVQGSGTSNSWILDAYAHYTDQGEDVSIHLTSRH